MNRKPIILTFIAHYLPGHKSGGPVRTIANMVEHLSDNFDFHIVTSDRDLADIEPYRSIALNAWNTVGRARVFYVSPENRGLKAVSRIISETPHDVLYLNSFFEPTFTLRPLWLRRLGRVPGQATVLAPRGELAASALGYKRWKKLPYLALARSTGVLRNITWQASSEYEAKDIRSAAGPASRRIFVAPNLGAPDSELPIAEPTRLKPACEPLRVCFLARISPVKNLEFALEVLRKVTVPVAFHIYGPIGDAGYWSRCQALINSVGPPVSVEYRGGVEHDRVADVLADYDLFFLPTRGENFGHAILEAMLAGTPVLISDTTPWRNLETLNVGWDLPLGSPDAFARAIEAAARRTADESVRQRAQVRARARRWANSHEKLESNRRLFLDSIENHRLCSLAKHY